MSFALAIKCKYSASPSCFGHVTCYMFNWLRSVIEIQKMAAKQISLTDKLIETRDNKRTVNIVYRGVLETTTWSEINRLADLYATVFLDHRRIMRTCALIGQYSMEAFAQYVACILTGYAVLVLEPDFPDRFDIIDGTETEQVIIDKKYLNSKLNEIITAYLSLWY